MRLQGDDIPRALVESGCSLLHPADVASALRIAPAALDPLKHFWNELPRDGYLRDGGRYRSRRHSCFTQEFPEGVLKQVPHRAHWQPTDYNALHGGMQRWFEPIDPAVTSHPAWIALLSNLGATLRQTRAVARWYIEAHQFRIDTTDGIGRPTPEGAHRDGVDYVAVMLVNRLQVRGGETRVFDAHGPAGLRFTMSEPWTLLLLDDARVIHETTPIQPDGGEGIRDTLVLTYRERGFQAPEARAGV